MLSRILSCFGILGLLSLVSSSSSASNNWAWISGSSSFNRPGTYNPTKGFFFESSPGSESGSRYVPGARSGSAMWIINDDPGAFLYRLYIFSGFGFGNSSAYFLEDVWAYDIASGLWAWVAGSSVSTGTSFFPDQRNQFMSVNRPPRRSNPCSFVYQNELYMYAGENSNLGVIFGDMWKFNSSLLQWAWVSGFSSTTGTSVYGTYRVGSLANVPAHRRSHTCWNPVNDVLYMFGGYVSSTGLTGTSNDLWSFDLRNQIWTWIHGSSDTGSLGVLGQFGVPDPLNTPPANEQAASWQIGSRLYLGFGLESTIWRFDIETFQWTWIFTFSNDVPISGTLGQYAANRNPGIRLSARTWTDCENNLFLHGGTYWNLPYADVWEFDLDIDLWRWINGNPSINFNDGNYGIIKVLNASNNRPGLGDHSSAFNCDFRGQSYFFGGKEENGYYSNSLWVYGNCPAISSSEGLVDCNKCKLGQFFNQTTSNCQPCEAGRFSTSFGLTSASDCLLCSQGKYSTSGQSFCSNCTPGRYGNSSGLCQDCDAGQFTSIFGASVCSSCDVGLYSLTGSSFCTECGIGSYSSSSGSSYCSLCPTNARTSSSGSKTIQDCFCIEDFWGSAFSGQICRTCNLNSAGTTCPSNSTLPKVNPGYFRDLTNPELVYECVPREACAETDYSFETKCSTGYDGFGCSNCLQYQYYRNGLLCSKCPSTVALVFTILIILAVLGFILYRLVRTDFKVPLDLKITVFWLQVIALYPNLSSAWPSSLKSMFKAASFTNINLELFSPECSVAVSFWNKTFIKLSIPFMIAAFLSSAYFALVYIYPLVSKRKTKIVPSKTGFFSVLIFAMSVMYTSTFSAAMSSLNCSFNGSDYALVYNPSIKCFDSKEWKTNFAGLFLLFATYGIGFPVFLIVMFRKLSKNQANSNTLRLLEPLLKPYQPKYFYWELCDLAKKTVFILLTDFLANGASHYTKVFVTSSFLFLNLAIEGSIRPFRTEFLNRVNFLWNLTGIILLMSDGLIFSLEEVTPREKNTFSVLLIILLATTLSYSSLNFMRILWGKRKSKIGQATTIEKFPTSIELTFRFKTFPSTGVSSVVDVEHLPMEMQQQMQDIATHVSQRGPAASDAAMLFRMRSSSAVVHKET